MVRLAYLVSHPIQYQAPLLRLLAREPGVYLKVFFGANTTKGFHDPGFGMAVKWDVRLLEGYEHEFLPALASREITTVRPLNWGIGRRLKQGAFDVLWVHGYTRLASWFGILAAKRLGLKVMVRDEANGIGVRPTVAKMVARRLFYSALSRVADAFLAIGTLNREYYRWFGITANRIFFVPYAVDNAFFRECATGAGRLREELRRDLGLTAGRLVILFSGKLIPRKGPLLLADAYRRLSRDGRSEPDAYLLFAGDGELRGPIEKMAADLGWRSMRVLGFKNQAELPALYDLCDLFVLPSFYEPWGLVVNEVMNAARPVIVSDGVGCWPDLVKPGLNGAVFPAGDVAALADAMRRVVRERQGLLRMGEASRGVIEKWSFNEDLAGIRAALARFTEHRA
ncbi:MAG: glycosyltransferase family 4 protein [Deltaproteobacteria bacterium]|nr:glycosyltransferase family 4 protein [Deltaproteobacteria bacterium]